MAEIIRPIDGWSIVHVATGAALGALGVGRVTAYALIFGTEMAELIGREILNIEFFGESGQNILMDLVLGIVSFEIASALRAQATPDIT